MSEKFKDIPPELTTSFMKAAIEFAADISKPISPIDRNNQPTKEFRAKHREKLRNEFVDAYLAIEESNGK